jgi:hypothetical protein
MVTDDGTITIPRIVSKFLIRFLTKVIEVLSPQGAYPLDITKAGFCGFGVFQ